MKCKATIRLFGTIRDPLYTVIRSELEKGSTKIRLIKSCKYIISIMLSKYFGTPRIFFFDC